MKKLFLLLIFSPIIGFGQEDKQFVVTVEDVNILYADFEHLIRIAVPEKDPSEISVTAIGGKAYIRSSEIHDGDFIVIPKRFGALELVVYVDSVGKKVEYHTKRYNVIPQPSPDVIPIGDLELNNTFSAYKLSRSELYNQTFIAVPSRLQFYKNDINDWKILSFQVGLNGLYREVSMPEYKEFVSSLIKDINYGDKVEFRNFKIKQKGKKIPLLAESSFAFEIID